MDAHTAIMLAAALQRLDQSGDPDQRVYAIEQAASKSRRFCLMSPEQAWQTTKNNIDSSHIYEVLSGPCNLYLDIEWIAKSAPQNERQHVECIVNHIRQCVIDTYGEDHDMAVSLVTASGYVTSGYKCSWHVHIACSKICWANAAAVGQFVRSSCSNVPEVDKVPYAGKGQNWRCVGSSKASDPLRKFVPATRETFLNCTVQQPVGNRSVIYPVADVPYSLDVPVPAYVQLLADSLETGGVATMCGDDRCVIPFRQLQHCEHVNRKHRSNHQYAVINTNTLMWKMNCHSCTDKISAWRTFDQAVLQKAFMVQCRDYTPTANRPPQKQKVATAPVTCIDVLTCGPPPFRKGEVYHCADGVYQ